MKKLLTLLMLSSILFACSSDDPDPNGGGNNGNGTTTIATPEMGIPTNPIAANQWAGDWNDTTNPNYRGRAYNPIEGDWILKQVNGKATDQFLLYELDSSMGMYVVTKKPADNKLPEIDYNGYKRYTINNTQLKDSRGYIYNYTVTANRQSMTLYDGTNTYSFIPYDFNGLWYWKGDWNDKNSVYYDIYGGKYNPIVGTWEIVYQNGRPNTEGDLRKFNSDFTVLRPSDPSTTRTYSINDTGVKEGGYASIPSYTYSYKISGDSLYYIEMPSGYDRILIRYRPK